MSIIGTGTGTVTGIRVVAGITTSSSMGIISTSISTVTDTVTGTGTVTGIGVVAGITTSSSMGMIGTSTNTVTDTVTVTGLGNFPLNRADIGSTFVDLLGCSCP